eukprot:CAMPEP_0174268502 /NCGR_PEP_ID=MMETSP0439-20130205/37678_1 /TAXON_ID=0 /ORGANISM="Stereomyxa ramosa, Strain Chinc5" /LENGTH=275 /DNA_ID=CAMNT_0015356711 /DNA_START=33 /DNA_END=860 /DNA_ORIENTATION=-
MQMKENRNLGGRVFEEDNAVTLLFRSYARIVGLRYIWNTFAKSIYSLEKQDLGNFKELNDDNYAILENLLDKIWFFLEISIDKFPYEFRHLGQKIKEVYLKTFNDERGYYQAIGSLLFMRFIIPAISAPHIYGLTSEEVSEDTQSVLIVACRVLQSLCMLEDDVDDDISLAKGWMEDHFQSYINFVDQLIDVEEVKTRDNAFVVPKSHKDNSLALLFDHTLTNSSAILTYCLKNAKDFDNKQHLEELQEIFQQGMRDLEEYNDMENELMSSESNF